MEVNYAKAIKRLCPGASFKFVNGGKRYEDIVEWNSTEHVQPSKQECDDAWNEISQNLLARKKQKEDYQVLRNKIEKVDGGIYKVLLLILEEFEHLQAKGTVLSEKMTKVLQKL